MFVSPANLLTCVLINVDGPVCTDVRISLSLISLYPSELLPFLSVQLVYALTLCSIPQEDQRVISVRSKWEAIVYRGLEDLAAPEASARDKIKSRL